MDKATRLGTQPVGKLLFAFSVPAITGMLVSALYNTVDRIFVGNCINEAALGGLTIAAPLMAVIFAFGMLFGVGSANLISVRLGEGKKDEAQNALTQCFCLLLGSGVFIGTVCLIFARPLLILFGGTPETDSFGYAVDYIRIILLGTPFAMLSFGFSHCTRAQGFPIITMSSMIIGAGVNILLDLIFVVFLDWGVSGAALATIIAQFLSMCWILFFSISKRTVLHLTFKGFRFSFSQLKQIVSFGTAQCLIQIATSMIGVLYNIGLVAYGQEYFGTATGGDAALAALGVVNSVLMLIVMPVFGINQGAQPILGYNYGAKQFGRVRKAYLIAALSATIVTTIGFIITHLFPVQLVMLFAPEASAELMAFGPLALKRIFMLMPIVGFQIVSANYFAVTGQPRTAILLSLSRQVIVLIPCLIIFPRIWGLLGIIHAAPVSDGIATILTTVIIAGALRHLKYSAENEERLQAERQEA